MVRPSSCGRHAYDDEEGDGKDADYKLARLNIL
jgi:hypothetical protein